MYLRCNANAIKTDRHQPPRSGGGFSGILNKKESGDQNADSRLNHRVSENPIGLDAAPRFSWKMESGEKNTLQQGYRVQVWDNYGETGRARGFFETGLLSPSNWQAERITHALPQEETARILGDREAAAKYGELYERIVPELNREYVTPNGRLVSETQTACVLLIYFDLLKEEYRDRVIQILEDNLNRHHGHLTTGFVGTAYFPFLCFGTFYDAPHGFPFVV